MKRKAPAPKTREQLALERKVRRLEVELEQLSGKAAGAAQLYQSERARLEALAQAAEDRAAKLLAERQAFQTDPDLEKTKRFVVWARENGVTAFEIPLGKFNVHPISTSPGPSTRTAALGRIPDSEVSDEDAFGASG